MTDPEITQDADFRLFAGLTIGAARSIFGQGSAEHRVVVEAWDSVGITVSNG